MGRAGCVEPAGMIAAGREGTAASGEGLVRAIGTAALAANVANLVVGAGIFVLPALVAVQVGPGAIYAYIVCAVLIGLVFLCFAEAGSRVHSSGGAYAYVETAFGPFAGFLTLALFWVGFSMLSDAAIANVLVLALATVVPELGQTVPRAVFLAVLFGGLASLNIVGVRQGARFVMFITVVKLVPLVLVAVLGMTAVRPEYLLPGELPPLAGLGGATLLLFFAFGGAESALTPSGEIRNPERTVPRGMLLGLGGVLVLYLALHGSAQGVLGPELTAHLDAPLAATAERVLGSWGGLLLVAAAALSIFGALSGDLLASPRAAYAAARDGLLPRWLAAVHPRFRTPHVAIIVFAGLSCTIAITGAFRPLAVVSSAALLVVYLAVSLSVLELRRRDVRTSAEVFLVPGGPAVPLLSSLVVLWVLSHSAADEAIGLGILLLLAAAAYFTRRLVQVRRMERACLPADDSAGASESR